MLFLKLKPSRSTCWWYISPESSKVKCIVSKIKPVGASMTQNLRRSFDSLKSIYKKTKMQKPDGYIDKIAALLGNKLTTRFAWNGSIFLVRSFFVWVNFCLGKWIIWVLGNENIYLTAATMDGSFDALTEARVHSVKNAISHDEYIFLFLLD